MLSNVELVCSSSHYGSACQLHHTSCSMKEASLLLTE